MEIDQKKKSHTTHVRAEEAVDVLEYTEQQLAPFLALLLRLSLQLEPLLLRLGEQRLELLDPFAQQSRLALVLLRRLRGVSLARLSTRQQKTTPVFTFAASSSLSDMFSRPCLSLAMSDSSSL